MFYKLSTELLWYETAALHTVHPRDRGERSTENIIVFVSDPKDIELSVLSVTKKTKAG